MGIWIRNGRIIVIVLLTGKFIGKIVAVPMNVYI